MFYPFGFCLSGFKINSFFLFLVQKLNLFHYSALYGKPLPKLMLVRALFIFTSRQQRKGAKGMFNQAAGIARLGVIFFVDG